MSRWIDADEVEKLLRAGCAYVIWELPSIDLVFCKECKHKDEIVNYCYENDRDVNPNGFCSYGEREGE